jgi:hypothetical protein
MKSDYQKGITDGLALLKKYPSLKRWMEHDIITIMQKLEDKYDKKIGNLACPITGEPAFMRISWYRDGIRDALRYGHGAKFVVVKHSGMGFYNIDSIAELTVYDDPALAWKRAWELDPNGHKYKSIDMLYVNGAVEKLGIRRGTE